MDSVAQTAYEWLTIGADPEGVVVGGLRRASGCMFGLAYGDALGKPTEFQRYEQIVAVYGPGGPQVLEGDPAPVTDDTQMALCVAEALLAALEQGPVTAGRLERLARVRFMEWAVSPENNRAPGMTCLQAIGRFAVGVSWFEASERGSKGCGANLRVAPVGLVPELTDHERAAAAQLQAALTHGHPTALAASELTAFAVHWLRTGLAPVDLPAALRERCREQREVYHGDWLGELWQRPGAEGPQRFIARGWDECVAVLDRLDAALAVPDPGGDPCLATGGGLDRGGGFGHGRVLLPAVSAGAGGGVGSGNGHVRGLGLDRESDRGVCRGGVRVRGVAGGVGAADRVRGRTGADRACLGLSWPRYSCAHCWTGCRARLRRG